MLASFGDQAYGMQYMYDNAAHQGLAVHWKEIMKSPFRDTCFKCANSHSFNNGVHKLSGNYSDVELVSEPPP